MVPAETPQLLSLGKCIRPNRMLFWRAPTRLLSALRMIVHFDTKLGGKAGIGLFIDPDRSSTMSRSGGSPRLTSSIGSVC